MLGCQLPNGECTYAKGTRAKARKKTRYRDIYYIQKLCWASSCLWNCVPCHSNRPCRLSCVAFQRDAAILAIKAPRTKVILELLVGGWATTVEHKKNVIEKKHQIVPRGSGRNLNRLQEMLNPTGTASLPRDGSNQTSLRLSPQHWRLSNPHCSCDETPGLQGRKLGICSSPSMENVWTC